MRKKIEFIEGAFYHVTSRTNNKIRVFENNLGRKIMLMTLQNAKDKFRFRLTNFCVMPTHIHLLIQPKEGTNLSKIMHWIKMHSAKRWNTIHGSIDHMWGERYFARAVKDQQEYDFIMDYIDQNPVVVGLSAAPSEWKASGAFYKSLNISNLVDLEQFDQKDNSEDIKLLSPIPFLIYNLMPPIQLEHTLKYYGVYAETLEILYDIVSKMPDICNTKYSKEPIAYLHYYTGTMDYFIYEYDKQNKMYGMVRMNVFPETIEYKVFSLTTLKTIQNIKLDFSWVPGKVNVI